jgi:hypothetical protein
MDLPDADEIAAEIRQGSQQPPPQPNPKDKASALKYAAEADKIATETAMMRGSVGMNMAGLAGLDMPMEGEDPIAF